VFRGGAVDLSSSWCQHIRMRALFVILSFLALSSTMTTGAEVAEPPLCTIRGLTQSCEFFKSRKDQPFILFPDRSWVMNPLYEGKPSKRPPPTMDLDKRFRRANELYDFAKGAILAEIAKGRSIDQLSSAEKSAYRRIETVNFKPPSFAASFPLCAKSEHEALYLRESHSFIICPGMLHVSDSQLVKVIGHEISHAIDPCNSEFPLVRVNQVALQALSGTSAEWPDELRNNADVVQILRKMKHNPPTYMTFAFTMDFQNPKSFDLFVKHGLFEIEADPIELKNHPASSLYQCFKESDVFKEVTASEIKTMAIQYAQSMGDGHSANSEVAIKKIENILSQHPHCIKTSGMTSQMPEVMSDAWGAKVYGRWLAENPPKSDLDKLSSISLHASYACRFLTTPDSFTNIANAVSEINSRHSIDSKRADLTVLSDPRAQTALGCRPQSQNNCMRLLGTSGKFGKARSSQVDSHNKSGVETAE